MCTEQEFKKILVSLPKLTDDQKKRLLPRLKMLGVIPSSQEPPPDETDEEWVRRGIARALKEKGISSASFLSDTMAKRAFKNYRVKTSAAAKVLEAGANKKLNYEEKMLIAELAAISMCDRFQGGISLKRILQCADQLPAYFDEAFPGYLSNKMATLVLKRKTNGRSTNN